MMRAARFVCLVLLYSTPALPQDLDLSRFRLVDLTHPFDDQTIYWPTAPSTFTLNRDAWGVTDAGYFYSSFSLCTPEHGGTHLDAPLHFAEKRFATAEIPLERLVGPAIVIDVSAQAQRDRNYRLTAADVQGFEVTHGAIEPGTIVLVRTGWSRYWPDRKAYLGDDRRGPDARLSFPGVGEDAARLLVEQRKIVLLGIDTASIDYGPSSDFIAHRIGAAGDVANLENLANLDQLPPRGATIVALPMKIAGGSGGPVRAIALVPKSAGQAHQR